MLERITKTKKGKGINLYFDEVPKNAKLNNAVESSIRDFYTRQIDNLIDPPGTPLFLRAGAEDGVFCDYKVFPKYSESDHGAIWAAKIIGIEPNYDSRVFGFTDLYKYDSTKCCINFSFRSRGALDTKFKEDEEESMKNANAYYEFLSDRMNDSIKPVLYVADYDQKVMRLSWQRWLQSDFSKMLVRYVRKKIGAKIDEPLLLVLPDEISDVRVDDFDTWGGHRGKPELDILHLIEYMGEDKSDATNTDELTGKSNRKNLVLLKPSELDYDAELGLLETRLKEIGSERTIQHGFCLS